jgi:hypothetical protein
MLVDPKISIVRWYTGFRKGCMISESKKASGAHEQSLHASGHSSKTPTLNFLVLKDNFKNEYF